MTDSSERLRWAREKAGYDTPTDAARALGIKEPTYLAHENGSRGFKAKAERYSRAFRVNLDWLVTGRGVPKNSAHEAPEAGWAVPVVGYVGAGAEVHPIDDHAPGAGLEAVDVDFPVKPGTVAVIVRGDSMLPIFEDGDLIGYMEDSSDPRTLVGKTCVVKLTDGRTFIKRLRRGSVDGLFTLVSFNARDIEDVEIEWARRYRFHIPADEWRASVR